MNRLEDDKVRYDQEQQRVRHEIHELEQKKGKQKDILEEMSSKLKIELDRVSKDLKVQQREVDRLEYEGEENEKDMKSSKK